MGKVGSQIRMLLPDSTKVSKKTRRASSPPLVSSNSSADPEVTRDSPRGRLILRVHRQLFAGEFRKGAPHRPRTARGVFIEVEPQFIGAPLGGRFVCAAIQNRFSHGQMNPHRRTLTALRWAIKPSGSARVSTASSRPR